MSELGFDRSAGGIVCVRDDTSGPPGQRAFIGRGTIDRIPIVLRIVPDGLRDGVPSVRVFAEDEVREETPRRELPAKLVDNPMPF